jgi:2-dehydropantoate 2-reductase
MYIKDYKNHRVLIYGSGAIGSIFGGKLAIAGFEVTMLARGKRLEELKENGLILENAMSGKIDRVVVPVVNELKEDDVYEYIIVTVQNTQIDGILPVLSANKSPNIVFVVNNPCGYQKWIEYIGYDRILIGFPSAGGERKDCVVTYFIGKGLAKLFQSTTFGELNGKKTERLKTLIKMFKKSGFSPNHNRNMDGWQKTHVCVIVPIGKALYKFDSDNYELSKSPAVIKDMIMSIRECFGVLRKKGTAITPVRQNFFYLPYWILAPIFSIVMNTRIAEFAMAKHTVVAKDEMAVLERLLRQMAGDTGERTPYLDALD